MTVAGTIRDVRNSTWEESPALIGCSAVPCIGWVVSYVSLRSLEAKFRMASTVRDLPRIVELGDMIGSYHLASAVRNFIGIASLIASLAAGLFCSLPSLFIAAIWGGLYFVAMVEDLKKEKEMDTRIRRALRVGR